MIAMLTVSRPPHSAIPIDVKDFESIDQAAQKSRSPKMTAQSSVLGEGIEFALVRSGYPMHNVRCHCCESFIRLTGHVGRYYYLQTAIEIARRLAAGRRIINEVEVLSNSNEFADDMEYDL